MLPVSVVLCTNKTNVFFSFFISNLFLWCMRMHPFLMSSHHLMEQSLSRCNPFIDEACWTHFSSNLVLQLIVSNAFQRFHFILISWQTFKNVYQNSFGCLCTNKKMFFVSPRQPSFMSRHLSQKFIWDLRYFGKKLHHRKTGIHSANR